jgi:hypothetical protein
MAEEKEFKVTNKQITVAGRKLTVFKKTFEMQLERFTLMEEAIAQLNGNGEYQEGESLAVTIRRNFKKATYPSLKACTTGKLFTEDECFKIEQDDLDRWLVTAAELNPDWFPKQGTETQEETTEKKQ